MINKNFFLISIILIAILSRFLPHPPNFTPITAIALLASKGFINRFTSFLVPLAAMIISDFFIGFHSSVFFVYGSYMLITFYGRLTKKISIVTVVISSIIFFVVTNFGVWLIGYPLTIEGFLACYLMAIPFFINTLLGDLFYSAIMIFSFNRLTKMQVVK
ncbi:MAG: DUF6580 family putative transport protein [Bacteroidota bacterium]|nr:DUF6580 family putative transport protein [Bacteroidota bacterium]